MFRKFNYANQNTVLDRKKLKLRLNLKPYLILESNTSRIKLKWLQFGVMFVFLGRAWQHWFYDAPYRELLWDQHRMEPWVKRILGIDWTTWVTSPRYDTAIASFIDGMGIFYLVCAIAVLLINKLPRVARPLLISGGLSLIFLAGLYYKAKLYTFGQFIEYGLQFTSPFLLVRAFKQGGFDKKLILLLKVAIAMTFVGHGLYAVNFHPRPANFLVMCINILPITETQAASFLNVAGTLDFIIAVSIFLPFRKVVFVAAAYAAFWGFVTAIARPWAYFHIEFWQDSLHRWLYEAAYRLIHGIGPLILALYYWQLISKAKQKGLAPNNSEQDLAATL